jgi:hypothetical protein
MHNKKARIILFIGLTLTLLLSGCKSAELQALEKAASSIPPLTTGREVRRSLQDKGTALGKPVYAEILIVYEPVNNHTRKDVYEEAVAILKKNNWVGSEESIAGYDYFKATLQQGGFKMSTVVAIDEKRNIVTINMAIH